MLVTIGAERVNGRKGVELSSTFGVVYILFAIIIICDCFGKATIKRYFTSKDIACN